MAKVSVRTTATTRAAFQALLPPHNAPALHLGFPGTPSLPPPALPTPSTPSPPTLVLPYALHVFASPLWTNAPTNSQSQRALRAHPPTESTLLTLLSSFKPFILRPSRDPDMEPLSDPFSFDDVDGLLDHTMMWSPPLDVAQNNRAGSIHLPCLDSLTCRTLLPPATSRSASLLCVATPFGNFCWRCFPQTRTWTSTPLTEDHAVQLSGLTWASCPSDNGSMRRCVAFVLRVPSCRACVEAALLGSWVSQHGRRLAHERGAYLVFNRTAAT